MGSERGQPPANVTTGDDIDAAITRAETLLASAEHAARACRVLLAAEVGAVALGVMAVILSVALGQRSPSGQVAAVSLALLLFGVLAAGLIHVALARPARRRLRRDARATMEIIDFLRELMLIVPEREGWNATRLRVANARIARFPIDAGGIK